MDLEWVAYSNTIIAVSKHMEYKGYIGNVEFDAEAQLLHGEVVGIRDVVTFQGRSIDEIQQAFRDSVDDYLAFCKERGEEPNKPCSGKFLVRVPSELHRRLDMLARMSGKSLNTVVTEFLEREVDVSMPKRQTARTRSTRKAASLRRPGMRHAKPA